MLNPSGSWVVPSHSTRNATRFQELVLLSTQLPKSIFTVHYQNTFFFFFPESHKNLCWKSLTEKGNHFTFIQNLIITLSEFLFPICIIMIELFQYFLAFSIQHSSLCAILALRVNWCTILLADLLEKSFWLKFTMHGEQPVIMLVTTVTMFYYWQLLKKNLSNPQITTLFAFSPSLSILLT